VGLAESYAHAIKRHGHEIARTIWRLTLENRSLLRQILAEEQIDCDYREPGTLSLALSAEQLAEFAQTMKAIQADGFSALLLDREQVQDMIATQLGPEIVGGKFIPENGLIHSARLVQGLVGAVQRHGARMCIADVTDLTPDGNGIRISTMRGTLSASTAVIAINAWTSDLIPGLARLITPVRGQVLAYAPIPPIFSTSMSAAITPTGEYWQQTVDGTIVLGGCRAVAPEYDVGVRVSLPTPGVQAALEGILPRLFPDLTGLRVEHRWAGLMAFTPDYLPIADRVPDMPHAWVVGGFSGHGMPFGLRLGQLLAHAVTIGSPPADLKPFRLDRPTLR
jgi:glycine/D-amino acid oxidase-like deaminating enzyme